MYVAETIKMLSEQNQYFITRVPQKIIEAKALLANLDTLIFTEMDDGYSGCFVESDYAGVRQKWLVVHSQQANKREQNNLEKRIEKSILSRFARLNINNLNAIGVCPIFKYIARKLCTIVR